MSKRSSRSHTKSGSGRYHGECHLIVDPTNGKILGTRTPVQRLQPAAHGGNWKGKQYLSYRESDRIRLLQLAGAHNRAEATELVMSERAA